MSSSVVQSACRLCARSMLFYPDTLQLECAACGTLNHHPQPEQLQAASAVPAKAPDALLLKAHAYRTGCYFDKADKLYTNFITDNPGSPDLHEAHWGLAMCRFGVEYVEDPASGRFLPTCHFTSPDPMQDDLDFKEAVALAPTDIREKYLDTGKYVDDAQQKIRELSRTMPGFDIFLCYKHTDPAHPGQATEDFSRTQQMYYELKARGYNVFFANITLKEHTGANYEAMIYHALNTSKVMLLFCSKAEYLDTAWVRSEWTRFIGLSKKDPAKKLMSLMYGMSPASLPVAISHGNSVEVLDMLDAFAFNYLTKSLENHFGPRLPDVSKALEKARTTLTHGSWSSAEAQLSEVRKKIDADKQRSEYSTLSLYSLLARLQLHTPEALKNCGKPFTDTAEWQEAREYASAEQKAYLDELLPPRSAIVSRTLEEAKTALENKQWKDAAQKLDLAAGSVDAEQQRDDFAMLNVYRLMTRYQLPHCAELARCSKPVETTPEWKAALSSASDHLQEQMKLWLVDLPGMLESLSLSASFNNDKTEATLNASCTRNTTLSSLTVPEGVVAIRTDAFCDCINLQHISLPHSLRSIDHAVIDCSRPGFVVELYDDTPLNENPFVNPTADNIRLIPTEKPTLFLRDDLLLQDCGNGEMAIIASMSHKTKLTVPDGVTTIRANAFSTLDPMASPSIVLPATLTTIENGAFANNPRLKTIRLPEKLTSIGASAFANCTGLMDIRLPASVTELGGSAFSGCSAMTSAVLSPHLSRISPFAFNGCSALNRVDIPDQVPAIGDSAFQNCASLTKLHLPASLSAIGRAAFNGCTSLAEINMPKGVTTLPDSIFMGCKSLRQIELNGPVVTVSRNAFSGCTSLLKLSFQQGLLEIGDEAFQNCVSLQRLVLPHSVHTFGRSVLHGVSRNMPILCPKNAPAEKWGVNEGFPVNPGGFRSLGGIFGHILLLPLRIALHLLILLVPLCIIGYFLQDVKPFAVMKFYIQYRGLPNGLVVGLRSLWADLLLLYQNPSNSLSTIIVFGVTIVIAILLLCYLFSCLRFVFWRKRPKVKRPKSSVK